MSSVDRCTAEPLSIIGFFFITSTHFLRQLLYQWPRPPLPSFPVERFQGSPLKLPEGGITWRHNDDDDDDLYTMLMCLYVCMSVTKIHHSAKNDIRRP